jgi:hypothetical protein
LNKYSVCVNSNNKGVFSVNVKSDFRYFILVRKDGYVPSTLFATAGDHREVIMCRSNNKLMGRVTDVADNSPIKNADIIIEYSMGHFRTSKKVVTDNNGIYQVNNIPNVIERLVCNCTNYDKLILSSLPIEYLNNTDVKLMPSKTKRIKLMLYDSLKDTLISEAKINDKKSIMNNDNVHDILVNKNDDNIFVSAENYCKISIINDVLKENEVYRINLNPSTNCYGYVIDTNNNPIKGVFVEAYFNIGDNIPAFKNENIETISYSDGCFYLNNLPIIKNINIKLKKDNEIEHIYNNITILEKNNYLGIFKYGYDCGLVGKITDKNGMPISGAWIMAQSPNGTYIRDLSDGNGNYKLMINCFNKLHVSKCGYFDYNEIYKQGNEITILPGQVLKKNIKLINSDYISGEVRDHNGLKVLGAKLLVYSDGKSLGKMGTLMTNSNGKFVIYGLEYGKKYYIKAFKDIIPSECIFKSDDLYYGGDKKINIILSETGIICGKVVNIDEKIVKNKNTKVYIGKSNKFDEKKAECQYSKSGYFSFVLEPDIYSIFAMCENSRSEVKMIEIKNDDIQNVLIRLNKTK